MFRFLETVWEWHLRRTLYGNRLYGRKLIVWTQTPRVNPGGLSDRLCGIVSAYWLSQVTGCDFKIDFSYPFSLVDFLRPNEVDWTGYDPHYGHNSYPVIFRAVGAHNKEVRRKQMLKVIATAKCTELHLYTNLNLCDDATFSSLFHTLFKPSELVVSKLQNYRYLCDNKGGIVA